MTEQRVEAGFSALKRKTCRKKVFFFFFTFLCFRLQQLSSSFMLRLSLSLSTTEARSVASSCSLSLSLPPLSFNVCLCHSPSLFTPAHLLGENRGREGLHELRHTDFPFVTPPSPLPPPPPLSLFHDVSAQVFFFS